MAVVQALPPTLLATIKYPSHIISLFQFQALLIAPAASFACHRIYHMLTLAPKNYHLVLT